MIRNANFAGKFYPGDEDELIDQIEKSIHSKFGPGKKYDNEIPLNKNIGIISPHAGYQFSGPLEAWGYSFVSKIGKPDNVILIGPSHSGLGEDVSIFSEGIWKSPLGEVEVNENLATMIVEKSSGLIKTNYLAHEYEHSLEVQLPFLQYYFGNQFKIVPIIILNQREEIIEAVSETLKNVIEDEGYLFVFSSDLNHYDSISETYRKDNLYIEELIKNGDTYKICKDEDISVCGLGPIAIGKSLFKKIEILKHITSGDIIDYDEKTVGYLSAALTEYK